MALQSGLGSTPRTSDSHGEARNFYFDREFGKNAVKILPGEFFVAVEDIALATVLGSCVSACIWDRQLCIGGMNHFMLPEGKDAEPVGLAGRYGVFAMEQLINELLKRGARKSNLEAKVFGGGHVMKNFTMKVGQRNANFVLDFLATENITIASQDLLDVHPRRVVFFPVTGKALVRKLGQADSSLLAQEQRYGAKLKTEPVSGDVELF